MIISSKILMIAMMMIRMENHFKDEKEEREVIVDKNYLKILKEASLNDRACGFLIKVE
jgi:hypothetical protein